MISHLPERSQGWFTSTGRKRVSNCHPEHSHALRASKCTVSMSLLFGVVLLAAVGCTTWRPNQTPVERLAREKSDLSNSIRIQYDSPPGRLAALGAPSADTFDPNMAALAATDTCRLSVIYPHPQGVPDMAMATVALLPEDFDDDGESVWDRFSGDEPSVPVPGAPLAAWTLDVPAWQVNTVVTKLREENFFRRARPLGAEVYLAVKIDDVGFGKDYKPVTELDSLITRIQRTGRPMNESAARLSRPYQPAAGVASAGATPQTARLPIAPHLGDGRVYRLPAIR